MVPVGSGSWHPGARVAGLGVAAAADSAVALSSMMPGIVERLKAPVAGLTPGVASDSETRSVRSENGVSFSLIAN